MQRQLATKRRGGGQSGLALVSVLTLAFVLMVLSALVLELSLKEIKMTAARRIGAQSFYLAEGGAVAARAALLAYMGADPLKINSVDASLSVTSLSNWYAGGVPTSQNPFGLLDYVVLDGQKFTIGATSATTSVTFQVNWSLPYTHLKLQLGTPTSNALGPGTYKASLTLTPWLTADPSCVGGPCAIHSQGGDTYEFFYTYIVTSLGQTATGRRQVSFSGNYSITVRRQNFARFALFTDVQLTPLGGAIWFTNRTTFDGPVHTNGEYRFAFFPQFGTPDPGSPCNLANIQSTPLTSVSNFAWFNNGGAPVELQANENVSSGTRIDAPVMPGCDPLNVPNNNPANFTRGVSAVTLPSDPFSQKGVSVGRNPTDTTAVDNQTIRNAVPELTPKDQSAVPNAIYVPIVDTPATGTSDAGKPMGGGIYVQGDLDSMTLSYSGPNAVYTLVQGTQTVTVTVDRVAQTTTVTNTAWPTPQTRTFLGVPKGWQSGSGNANATMVYVEGNLNSISGTLGQNDQATVAASGNINITNHLVYQVPPVVTDPTSNPTNVLGLYSAGGDITIDPSAPNDLQVHAVMMAGSTTSSYNSSVNVINYNSGSPRGQIHLIGGVIEKYYGPFGTFSSSTGSILTGYGRDFKYDRRMSRGFTPPFFPTTSLLEQVQGSSPLAGARPTWREQTPP